ncbi:MAG: hypothetical protein EB078_03610 [Proteobacteria bacterium]|nr:hypothetical protein [Pseudomonadota bacterium]NDC23928.1 hypothetical protein [Pseudomonadota bacterium]NDD03969.1 hypothetical protein [Pseudomonadota bacterium]NDG26776.1 hypothetical protein [Pseudomonadota bacterium]
MARTPLIRTDQFPFHITGRSNNREWFYIPIGEFWNVLIHVLNQDVVKNKLQIHALVLMSNHFHLMASSVEGDLSDPMQYLMREVCRIVNKRAGRINHVFGGPYKWTLITNTSYYLHCLKYVYRNPVSANICDRVEQYPYSSLMAHRNPQLLPFSVQHWRWAGDWMKWGDYSAILSWLNTPYPHGLNDYLKRGMRHPRFVIPKKRSTRKVPSEFWEELNPIYNLAPYPFEELSPQDRPK